MVLKVVGTGSSKTKRRQHSFILAVVISLLSQSNVRCLQNTFLFSSTRGQFRCNTRSAKLENVLQANRRIGVSSTPSSFSCNHPFSLFNSRDANNKKSSGSSEANSSGEKKSMIQNTNRSVSSGILKFRKKLGSGANDHSQEIEVQRENEKLRLENDLLRDKLRRLKAENENLHHQQMIVLETFEGEGKMKVLNEKFDDDDDYKDINILNTKLNNKKKSKGKLSLSPSTDDDISDECIDVDGSDTCPIEPDISFGEAFRDRAYWLVGLLFMQSASGVILSRNEALIADHPIIVFFLTMLVGAGGNAGNQASVRVIRGLALGTLNEKTQNQFLIRELKMAFSLSAVLSVAGFLRAALFRTPFPETIAVTTSLSIIVFTSICLGAVLPLLLKKIGVDPAHSSTSIQVVMDILGVLLAVFVSHVILDSPLGGLIMTRIIGG